MPIKVLAPVSGRKVTCGVTDYVESVGEALRGRDDVSFEIELLEPEAPLAFVGALVRHLRAGGIIQFNLPVEGWGNSLLPGAALFLARLFTRRGKIALTVHEWKSLNRPRFLSQLPDLWAADQIVLVSREQWEAFRASSSAPKRLRDSAALIPIGANIKGQASAPPARLAPRRDAGPVVGYFGVLYASKQPELMLRAFAVLKARAPGARLMICGDFLPDKPQDRAAFFSLADELGVTADVDFRGRIEASGDVLGALAEADAHLLLFSDGASARRSSLLTCLQLDRPVVTTAPLRADEFVDWPDIERQMADGSIATVAPDADPEDIADVLLATLRAHPTRSPIDSVSIWRRVGDDHARLYEKLSG
jgi:glycosyltransferase involved in cell wall biosynthesis